MFSSKIAPEVEDAMFDLLLNHLSQCDFESVYVKNLCIIRNQILFFAEIDKKETIIQVPIKLD